jgi:hypothetical protein
MWFVLVAVILIVAGFVLAALFRRPSGDDLHSVRSYHAALGTLEHLSDRVGTASVEPVRQVDGSTDTVKPDPGIGGTPTTRSVPPVPVRGSDEFPDPGTPLVFDDARPRDRYVPRPSPDGAPVTPDRRAQRHALESMNHRARRGTTVMIVVAALVLFGVLAYVGSRRSNPQAHSHSTTQTTSRSHATSPATTGRSHGGTGQGKHGKTKPTPTTLPIQIVAVSSTTTSAIYPVVSSSFTITVTASGPCWVAATTASSGSTLWAGTLPAGVAQAIPATGVTTVQFGTPTVSFAVNNIPVVLPTTVHTPFTVTFQPTATSSSSTTAVTTAPGVTSVGAASTTTTS